MPKRYCYPQFITVSYGLTAQYKTSILFHMGPLVESYVGSSTRRIRNQLMIQVQVMTVVGMRHWLAFFDNRAVHSLHTWHLLDSSNTIFITGLLNFFTGYYYYNRLFWPQAELRTKEGIMSGSCQWVMSVGHVSGFVCAYVQTTLHFMHTLI